MIRTDTILEKEPGFDFSLIGPKERIVFFDIETTGLKASNSQLYLIGAAVYEDGAWHVRQFFAESPVEEVPVLTEFSKLLREKAGDGRVILVTYNGDTFDIPYLKTICSQYSLGDIFRNCVSFDLYRYIKPCKKEMGVPDLKLKTVEKICGIDREDKYGGGELIYVYEEYLRLNNIIKGGCEDNTLNDGLRENCLRCLLLHNEEDVADMLSSMGLYGYRLLKDGEFDFTGAEVAEVPGLSSKVLDVKFTLRCPLPKELYVEEPQYVISASGKDRNLLELCLTLAEGEMRYFFADWKNYYYLPEEDRAVHRSLASFVPAERRKKATAETAYAKKEGLFFPEPKPVFCPVFRKTAKGALYAELTGEVLTDGEKWKELLLAVL